MVRPASQFCCGCSLSFGVVCILLANLLQNLFYIVTAFSNIILKVPLVNTSSSLTSETFTAAFCLVGVPFIFCGFWGVLARMEGHVRMYFYYMVTSLSLDLLNLILFLASGDLCGDMPSILEKHGSAFACGFMRIVYVLAVVQVVIIQTYCLYTVWSLCEDLRASGGGPGLPELLQGASAHHSKRRYLAPHTDEHFGVGTAGYPVAYGAFNGPGMGGSTRLFNGSTHETSYPPVKHG
mmetsp:Transcript_90134/g.226895  ORF Transcript_90134/g.226895 Transcript_90134/m.226895 type:complete len:237 (-) Transcript_90134:31-741(-)